MGRVSRNGAAALPRSGRHRRRAIRAHLRGRGRLPGEDRARQSRLYTGAENVPAIDEATQGTYYAQLIAMMACDPNVALLNFFHAVDETSLPAWQSGARAAGRHAARVVLAPSRTRSWPTSSARGTLVQWRHTDRIVGGRATFKLPRSFLVRAAEGFSYDVKITRATSTRRLTGAAGQGEAARDVLFKLPRLRRGSYRVTVTLHAESNPDRTATFTRTLPRLSGHVSSGRSSRRPECDIRTDMTDPRVAKLADLLVNYSLELKPGQIVRHRRRDRGRAVRPRAATERRCAPVPIRAHACRGRGDRRHRGRRGVGGAAEVRLGDRPLRGREGRRDRDDLGRPEHARPQPGRSGACQQEDRVAPDADEPLLGADRRGQGASGSARASRRTRTRRTRRCRSPSTRTSSTARATCAPARIPSRTGRESPPSSNARARELEHVRELRIVGPDTDLASTSRAAAGSPLTAS